MKTEREVPRPRRQTAGEVVDAQGDLADRLRSHTVFRRLVASILEKAEERSTVKWYAPDTTQRIVEHVELGAAYRVSADMVALIEAAGAAYRDLDRFDVDTIPTRCGFVSLDRPLVSEDIHGRQMFVHYLTWGPVDVRTGRELLVTLWNDTVVQPDYYTRRSLSEYGDRVAAIAGRWGFIGADRMQSQMRVGPMKIQFQVDGRTVSCTNIFRYVVALFEMLGQTVVTTTEERPERAVRRRAIKRGVVDPGKITVVTLRRQAVGDHPVRERSVDWTHRWVVAGHWRRQPYGPRRSLVRKIWINDFIKGPEDRPLVVGTKVYDLRR